jgi:ankyrin repeat protein
MQISRSALAFSDLPVQLQSSIFALGGAPLETCKAAAAVNAAPDLTATWLTASHPYPLKAAALAERWDVCAHLLNGCCIQPQALKLSLPLALSVAAHSGPVALVSRLVAEGAWAEVCGSKHSWSFYVHCRRPRHVIRGFSIGVDSVPHPLVSAVENNRADVAALLLQQPGEQVPASLARNVLCSAAEAGNIPMMQLLISSIPAVREPGTEGNPLSSAALGGHIPALQFLLQQGAHPQNMHGTPFSSPHALCPLQGASYRKQPYEVMRFLCDHGIRWGGWLNALVAASRKGDVQVVQLLLSTAPEGRWWGTRYPDEDLCDCPLYNAAQHKHTAVMKLLLQTGAWMPTCCITGAFRASIDQGNVGGLALLRQHGAQVDGSQRRSLYESTQLKSAIHRRHTAVVKWLLDNGATAGLLDLCAAVEYGAAGAVKLLLRHGVRDHENQALFMASCNGLASIVPALLDAPLPAAPQHAAAEKAARMDIAMCAAASWGQVNVVRFLLKYLSAPPAPAAATHPVTGPGAGASGTAAAARGSAHTGGAAGERRSDGRSHGENLTHQNKRGYREEVSRTGEAGAGAGVQGAGGQPGASNPTPPDAGSVLQMLQRAMEAAAAGREYCRAHTHLLRPEDGYCQGAVCWARDQLPHYYYCEVKISEEHPDWDDNYIPLEKALSEISELLITAGVDPAYDGCRFLLRAIVSRNSHMVDILLPLCTHYPAVFSGTALKLATQFQNQYAVQQLEAHM